MPIVARYCSSTRSGFCPVLMLLMSTDVLVGCQRDLLVGTDAVASFDGSSAVGEAPLARVNTQPWELTVARRSQGGFELAPERHYVIDLERSNAGAVDVNLDSWSVRPAGKGATYPLHAKLTDNGDVTIGMSDGATRSTRFGSTAFRARIPMQPLTVETLGRDPSLFRRLTPGRGIGPSGIPASQLDRTVSPEDGRKRLRALRDSFPDEVRLTATRVEFRGVRGEQSIRLIFDETVGAVIELASKATNGNEVMILSEYRMDGGVHRLFSRETRVSGVSGVRVFREAFPSDNRQETIR